MGLPVDQRDSGQGATGAGQHRAKSGRVSMWVCQLSGLDVKGKEKKKERTLTLLVVKEKQ